MKTNFGVDMVQRVGSAVITDPAQLCLFAFDGGLPLEVTGLLASFTQTDNETCDPVSRVVLFSGVPLDWSGLAQDVYASNLDSKYGIRVLRDVVGVQEGVPLLLDFSDTPCASVPGQRFYALLMCPVATASGSSVQANALLTMSLFGRYVAPGEASSGDVYPKHPARY